MCEGVVPNRTIANKQKIKNKQNNNNNNNDRHKNSKLDTTTTTTTKSKNDLPWYNRHGEIFSLRNLPAVLNASIMFVAIPNLCMVIYMGATRWDALRMFTVWFFTASPALVANHRFFAHNAFKVSRVTRFGIAIVACLGLQYGPCWWSSKHRRHHKHCDLEDDPHSWMRTSMWYAWLGWPMAYKEQCIDTQYVHPSMFVDAFISSSSSSSNDKDQQQMPTFQLPQWLMPPQSIDSIDDNNGRKRVLAPEMLLIDKLWWVPSVSVQLGLYFIMGFSARSIFLYYTAPVTWVTIPILLFNVMFHPPDQTPTSKGCYALDSLLDPLTFLMGESHHEDHHAFPDRAKRPQILDLSYWLFVAPMLALGLAWDPKIYNHGAIKRSKLA
jgi:fatty-acid desaturase